MARRRGTVTVTDADGKTYTLRYGTNAIVKIQQALKKPLGQILKSLEGDALDMEVVRTMVQMGIEGTADLTPEQVGDLIDDVGLSVITKAFGAVFAESGGDSPLTTDRPGSAAA